MKKSIIIGIFALCLAIPAFAFNTTNGTFAPVCSYGTCTEATADHRWSRPSNATDWNGHLCVFLGGANNTPAKFERILKTAARAGYHAVALAYKTSGLSSALQADCKVLTSANEAKECYREGRHRAAYCREGVHTTTFSPAPDFYSCVCGDDVKSRLTTFLDEVVSKDPSGDWPSFDHPVRGYRPRKTVIAGFSGGAGVAWYMSTRNQFHAVVMLDGVADVYDANSPSPQLAALDTNATCGEDFFVLNHNNNSPNPNNSAFDRPTQMMLQWDNLSVPVYPSSMGLDTLDPTDDEASQPGSITDHRYRIMDTCSASEAHGSVAYDDHLYHDSSVPCGLADNDGVGLLDYYLSDAYFQMFSNAPTEGGACP